MARFEGSTYGPIELRRRLRAELGADEKLIAWGVVHLNPTTMSGFAAAAMALVPVFGALLVVAAAASEALRAVAVLTDERLLLLKIDRSAVKVREVGKKKGWWLGRAVRRAGLLGGGVDIDRGGSVEGAEVVGGDHDGRGCGGPGWGACSGYESGGAGVLASVKLGRVRVEVDEAWLKKRTKLMSAVRGESALFVLRIDLDDEYERAVGESGDWAEGDDDRLVWELKPGGRGGRNGRRSGGRGRGRGRGRGQGRERGARGWAGGNAGVGGAGLDVDRGGVYRARRGVPEVAKLRVLVKVTSNGGGLRLSEAFFTLAGEDLAGD